MICRDIIVDASRMYASTKGKVVAANIWGKLKTVFQMIAIILILLSFGIVSNNLVFQYLVQNFFLLVATVFSVVSGVIYEVQIFKKEKHANEQQKTS
jgi:CDP-diacylglycerol--glycerol-3-phosphate 3-phosphatidyltransferase